MKILIIRLSAIGDIVLTSPVVRCLAEQLPEAELHFLVKPNFRTVVTDHPELAKIHVLQSSLWQTIRQLRAERFDYVVDLHHNQRTWFLKLGLGVRAFSFRKLNVRKWLAVRLKQTDWLPKVHIVERYLETVKPLGVKEDGKGLEYFIAPADEVDVAAQFPAVGRQPFVAVVLGATYFTKRLPKERWLVALQLIQQPVILLGGKEDMETGEWLAAHAGAHVHDACGQLRLQQSASVVRQAEKVITHDTGLMHIAAAFGKPIASIWGNTVPEFGMYPYLPNPSSQVFEVKDLPCRPCSKIGYQHCPQGHFRCMNDIEVDQLAAWANGG